LRDGCTHLQGLHKSKLLAPDALAMLFAGRSKIHHLAELQAKGGDGSFAEAEPCLNFTLEPKTARPAESLRSGRLLALPTHGWAYALNVEQASVISRQSFVYIENA
jgi:hypothetical protein